MQRFAHDVTTFAVSNQQDTNWYLNYKVLQRWMQRAHTIHSNQWMQFIFESFEFDATLSFDLFFLFFPFLVVACLFRVSCVQPNDLQRHTRTWIFISCFDSNDGPNATGTCVSFSGHFSLKNINLHLSNSFAFKPTNGRTVVMHKFTRASKKRKKKRTVCIRMFPIIIYVLSKWKNISTLHGFVPVTTLEYSHDRLKQYTR